MESKQCIILTITLLLSVSGAISAADRVTCRNRGSRCFLKSITCPHQCPKVHPGDPKAKGCYLDCNSPKCEAVCRHRKANCNSPGAACFDPRFVGGDGVVFYFHGRSNQHFALISDTNLQINARFIGHRPNGRTRDYTWIQALGLTFHSHTFTVGAKKVEKWDDEVDQLEFSYDGKSIDLPQQHLSEWSSPQQQLKLERTSNANSVTVTLSKFVEILITVVPITQQDDKIHNYQVPSNDCFAHLEVQFRFMGLSHEVEGVLGKTYRPDFVNPAKPGVAMAVVGGEDRYKTSSLLSTDCASCVFSPTGNESIGKPLMVDYATLDCGSGGKGGYGIVCKK